MHTFITLALLVLVVLMAFEIRELRAQNRRMAVAVEAAHAERGLAEETAHIAAAALLAEEAYSEDHQMLVAQARDAMEGEGGRPAGVWAGDEFVPVDPGEADDVEVGQPVAGVDDSHREPWIHLPGETYDWKQN